MDVGQIFAKTAELTANYLGCPKQHLTPHTDLISDYYVDSLDRADLVMEIESAFCVELPDDALSRLRTLEDMVLMVRTALALSCLLTAPEIAEIGPDGVFGLSEIPLS